MRKKFDVRALSDDALHESADPFEDLTMLKSCPAEPREKGMLFREKYDEVGPKAPLLV